jgi:hypothetical protein
LPAVLTFSETAVKVPVLLLQIERWTLFIV